MYTEKDTSRVQPEEEKEMFGRTPYRRDYGRLLHSPSFRRLQGKTQLFPGSESDFFRNRLTHSLEVAQIAKGIAQYLNATDPIIREHGEQIDVDLVEFAGLAHDLGHPPFGHNGERALDACMKPFGGFEGNAQTLRILTKVERKVYKKDLNEAFVHGIDEDGSDGRLGLNLTYRSLASILKYDSKIPSEREPDEKLCKGYYESEADIVESIKIHVAPEFQGDFKTLECQIMDIADDIAYSTYDLEDAMKAGFTTPLDMISRAHQSVFLSKLHEKIQPVILDVTEQEILQALMDAVGYSAPDPSDAEELAFATPVSEVSQDRDVDTYLLSCRVAENSHVRTQMSSRLVHKFMMGISVKADPNMAMAKIDVERGIRLKIEALKHLTYLSMIMSPRLKVVEHRGEEIVTKLFETLSKNHNLLPQDVKTVVDLLKTEKEQKRVICDFVAGMTDRYAVEFYNRLFGSAASLFVPI